MQDIVSIIQKDLLKGFQKRFHSNVFISF